MPRRLKKYLPSPETIRRNRWLQWLGPALLDPRLWHFSRRGVATGVAIGVFFGFLVPVGQIPLAAGAAILLRGYVPGAVASTFVTNPLTFGPVFVTAWYIGNFVLGQSPAEIVTPDLAHPSFGGMVDADSWFTGITHGIGVAGKPIIVGLSLLAVVGSLLSYLLVSWSWRLAVVLQRRRAPAERQRRGTIRL